MEAAGLVALITAFVGLITYAWKARDESKAANEPAKKAKEIDHAFTTHDAVVEGGVMQSTADRLQRMQIDNDRTGSPPR
ncbi:MAG: hypothetical protein Q7U76_12885 [Nitrospirota bacterium]|nr:hypothetical protein [Nitrospirota bacterium]